MIVRNEERFLEQCLRSIADAVDEICIVDTGSTDGTIAIATSFGATVVERPWRNDFSWARNEALALATRRWVIMLDADEELVEESKSALRTLGNTAAHHTGVWIRCLNKSDDYQGTGSMSHALVRVFPNSERIRFRGLIHEFAALDGSSEGLAAVVAPISIVHHGYLKDVVADRDKANRNYEIVRAATQADPTDAFAWFNLGSTAYLMGNYEAARDGLEKMRELNGSARRGFIANGYAILAEIYSDKLHDPIRGETIAREGLQFSPRYANAHFQLGKTLVAQGRFDEGRAAFHEAIADGAYNAQQFVVDDQVSIWKAHSEIGASYVAEGEEQLAIEWFRKGLKNAPRVAPLRLNLARALERCGDVDAAGALFRGVFDDFGDDAGTVDLVNFLLRRQDGAAALEIIERTHEHLSDAVAAALLHAAAQIAMQTRGGDALPYLEIAAKRSAANTDVLNWLEILYRERGDDAALATLRDREAALEPSTPAEYLRRSYHANVEHDFARGFALAQAGLQRAPTDEHLHYNAAVSAAALGESSSALAHLTNVSSIGAPVYIPAQLLEAKILRTLARSDEAIAALERALAADPNTLEALTLRAEIYESMGDLPTAESSLRRALAANPAAGAVALATFLLRHGRYEEAAVVADHGLQA